MPYPTGRRASRRDSRGVFSLVFHDLRGRDGDVRAPEPEEDPRRPQDAAPMRASELASGRDSPRAEKHDGEAGADRVDHDAEPEVLRRHDEATLGVALEVPRLEVAHAGE